MRLSVSTAPAEEPITLTELKAQLRLTGTDDDTDLADFIQMAREYAETFCRRAIITQSLTLKLDDFPSDQIELPRPPLQTVTSIKYWPLDGGAQVTVSAATVYEAIADELVGRVQLRDGQDWPSDIATRPDAVEIIYVAGYGSQASVPAALKMAMRQIAAKHYEQRSADSTVPVTIIPMHTETLLWFHRVLSF
jgi:uncharacterized phiE125 gp8 family phage protein